MSDCTHHRTPMEPGPCPQCQREEIERLRAEREKLWETLTRTANESRAEIERLRREHEKVWADAALKDAEIERLHDILLRMMLCQGQTTAQGTLMLVPPDVLKQAKEALGDE